MSENPGKTDEQLARDVLDHFIALGAAREALPPTIHVNDFAPRKHAVALRHLDIVVIHPHLAIELITRDPSEQLEKILDRLTNITTRRLRALAQRLAIDDAALAEAGF